MGERICSIDGCPKAVRARGWCGTHYSRWYTKGHPLAIVGYGLPEAERFWPKVDASGDCWIWTANRSSAGYGNFYTAAQHQVCAHRWAYEHLVGPIPDGLDLDHLCRNPPCVSPDHLEPVTHRENVRRGAAGAHFKARTHCNHGHEFTPDNTAFDAKGSRRCRECGRAACLAYYYKTRGR